MSIKGFHVGDGARTPGGHIVQVIGVSGLDATVRYDDRREQVFRQSALGRLPAESNVEVVLVRVPRHDVQPLVDGLLLAVVDLEDHARHQPPRRAPAFGYPSLQRKIQALDALRKQLEKLV